MVDGKTLRSLLPGKIAQVARILAEKEGRAPLEALKDFYASGVYADLEREETKCWWMSPRELAEEYERDRSNQYPAAGIQRNGLPK